MEHVFCCVERYFSLLGFSRLQVGKVGIGSTGGLSWSEQIKEIDFQDSFHWTRQGAHLAPGGRRRYNTGDDGGGGGGNNSPF